MRIRNALLGVAALLSLAACGTTRMPLSYTPQSAIARSPQAQPILDVGQVTVSRRTGRENPMWIGTIRGGYGNPVKALEADVTVDQVVARALRDGMRARGLLATSGTAPQRRLNVDVAQFDANQFARREATVELRVSVQDVASGQQLWADTVRAFRMSGTLMTAGGVFGSVEDLHALTTSVLAEAVDRTLDNPGLLAAVGTGGAAAAPIAAAPTVIPVATTVAAVASPVPVADATRTQPMPAAAPPAEVPLGGGVQREFRLANRTIPLPPGPWRVVHLGRRQGRTDRGAGNIQTTLHDAVLVQERGGRAAGVIVASTASEIGVHWGPFGICQGGALTRTITSAIERNVDCQGVLTWRADFSPSNPPYMLPLYAEGSNRPGWIPQFWVAASYAFSDNSEYFTLQYRFDPAVYAPEARRDLQVWRNGFMAPPEQQFVDRLTRWVDGSRQAVRAGYRGQYAGAGLAEP